MQLELSKGHSPFSKFYPWKVLLQPEHVSLISSYYGTLEQHRPTRLQSLRDRWSSDIPDHSEENWEGFLNTYFVTTISVRDKMIHLHIFHRIYYTPVCHECHSCEGNVFHMLWNCEKIRPFWSNVTHFIATNFDLHNMCNPKWCIWGVMEEIDLSSYQKQFLRFFIVLC